MLVKKLLLFFIISVTSAYAANEEGLELLEKWTISPEQQTLAPISSPVEISIDTTDGRVDALRIDITNTQPPSMLSNKAVASGKRSAWLKNVSLVLRPAEDYYIWSPGEKGEKDRKGAEPFTINTDAKVNIEKDGAMVRSILPISIQVYPYKGGYGATVNYSGERKPKSGTEETSVLTESGSNPVFTIQGFGLDYFMTVKGRVDVKMSEYKKLYEGSWYK